MHIFFKIKIQPYTSEQEKKKTKKLWFAKRLNQAKFFLSIIYKAIFFFLAEEELFKEKGSGRLNKNRKNGFLTALTTVIKNDPTTSLRKCANELKVHEKTARTAIKQN